MIPKEKHIKEICDLIPKHPIFSFKDVFVFYKGCTRQWAYSLEIDKNDTIKELIYSNRRKGVSSLLSKWLNSDNATLNIAAMRLISEPEERQMLNQQYIDMTTNQKDIQSSINLQVGDKNIDLSKK